MAGVDERASDSDREQAVAWLQDHLLAGRLTLEEFSERVDQAYAAVGHADLERVRTGLPSTEQLPAPRSLSATSTSICVRPRSRVGGQR